MRRILCALFVLLSATAVSAQQRFAPPKVTTLTGLNGNQGDIVNLVGTGDYLCSATTCTSASDWKQITSGGSTGAPTDATYITKTANSSLSAEQALGALATGLMNSATTTGVVTTLVPTDDNLVVGSGTAWELKTLTTCTGTGKAVTYDASANTFGCNTIASTPASPVNAVQFNSAGAFGGDANFDWAGTTLSTPSAPAVTPLGATGAAHWKYVAQAYRYTGGMAYSTKSATTTITNGNAALDGTNKNSIVVAAVTGADIIEVFRLYDGAMGTPATSGPIGSVSGAGGTLVDTGLTAPVSIAFAVTAAVPTGNTSTGLFIADHLNQADLGDAENAAWFGTSRLALGAITEQPYMRSSFSKYVFSHAGTTNNLLDTMLVLTVPTTVAANNLESIMLVNGATDLEVTNGATSLYVETGSLSTGTVSLVGIDIAIAAYGAGSPDVGYGLVVEAPTQGGAGQIGDWYSVRVKDVDMSVLAGSAYGYFTNMSADTDKWAFYGSGTAASHFGGAVEIAGSVTTALAGSSLPVCETNGVIYAGTNTAGVLACP